MSDFKAEFFRRMPSKNADAVVVGYCAGVIADGRLDDAEIAGLRVLMAHSGAKAATADVLLSSLHDWNEGVLSNERLADVLRSIAGGDMAEGEVLRAATFCCDPDAVIDFAGSFVLTGDFATGTRKECNALVKKWGGKVRTSVSVKTDCVVIGESAASAYLHGTYGRKVQEAMKLRDDYGADILIVSEADWLKQAKSLA